VDAPLNGLMIKFPFDSQQQTYGIRNADLHTAVPARFVQETSLDRLRVYKFQTTRQRSLVRV